MKQASKKLKIAFFSEDFSRQAKGTAIVIQKLAEQFLVNFSDQVELTLIRKEGFCPHPLAKKIRTIEIKVYKTPIFSTLVSYFVFFFKNREEFDAIIFNRNVYPGFWFLNAKKFILWLHDAPVNHIYREKLKLENKLFYFFLKYIGKHFLDAVIAVSNDARRGILNYLNLSPDQVAVIYNGVGAEFRPFSDEEKARAEKELKEKYNIFPPYILSISRLEPHKNIHTLIDAFLILRNQHQTTHKLIIVGERHFPKYAEIIESKISNFHFDQDILIVPFIEPEDLPAVYNLADVLAFPSLMEGFGLPLTEAMSCGLPIVASDLSVMSEITAGSALLADPRDPNEIADKIHRLLSDSDLRAVLAKRGLERSKIFSWRKTAEDLIEIIKK